MPDPSIAPIRVVGLDIVGGTSTTWTVTVDGTIVATGQSVDVDSAVAVGESVVAGVRESFRVLGVAASTSPTTIS
jgi:hypothetical protein